MRAPKYYKCELCGKNVFKKYDMGQLVVVEIWGGIDSEDDYINDISHNCSFNLNNTSEINHE